MRFARRSCRFLFAATAATALLGGGLAAAAPAIGDSPVHPAPADAADPALVSVNVLPAQSSSQNSYNGLAQTPPMGFNDWNAYGCNINEDVIKQTADAMASNGMRDAGYQYVNIDDCWQDGRSVSGNNDLKRLVGRVDGHLVADPVFFPSGMPALADYIHAKGLKFGLYTAPARARTSPARSATSRSTRTTTRPGASTTSSSTRATPVCRRTRMRSTPGTRSSPTR